MNRQQFIGKIFELLFIKNFSNVKTESERIDENLKTFKFIFSTPYRGKHNWVAIEFITQVESNELNIDTIVIENFNFESQIDFKVQNIDGINFARLSQIIDSIEKQND